MCVMSGISVSYVYYYFNCSKHLGDPSFLRMSCKLMLKLRVLARAWLSSFGVLCPGVTHGSQVSSTSGHTGSWRECIPDVVTLANFSAGCVMGDIAGSGWSWWWAKARCKWWAVSLSC